MKKNIFLALALAVGMTACTDDYTDWADPQHTDPEVPEKATLTVQEVAATDLAQADSALVQVYSPVMVAPEGTTIKYELRIIAEDGSILSYAPTTEGYIQASELQSAIETLFGKRPVEHEMKAMLLAYVDKNGTTVLERSNEFVIKATPEAPVIESAYYLVGDMVGWDADHMVKFNHSGKDVYEDSEFSITFTTDGENKYWKIIPQSNVDAGNIWADGVVGVVVDGDDSMSGSLVNVGANAGKIAEAGMYKMTINMMDYTYTITKLEFPQFIYFIGATDGWTNAEQKLESPSFDGVYTGYIYCADPNGWGNQFKFQKTPGDWGTEINAGHFTSFNGAATDCGGNIGVSGGQNVYYFEVNLAEGTISATEVTKMGIIGDFNGWGGDVDMTWNATDYCFEASNAGVTAAGWKFRVNADWGLNLGGTLDKLVGNGDNLNVAGNTVKLYPTRKGSDNIYCTVE